MDEVTIENKIMKETILDIQTRSMRNNLIFSGSLSLFHENTTQTPTGHHKPNHLPQSSSSRIRLKKKSPRLIIVKLEHYKHKEFIKSKGKELKGTHYGINDQFPREINDRRRILYPIMKKHRQNNTHANIIVDKLFIEGQLYRDSKVTPWLF